MHANQLAFQTLQTAAGHEYVFGATAVISTAHAAHESLPALAACTSIQTSDCQTQDRQL